MRERFKTYTLLLLFSVLTLSSCKSKCEIEIQETSNTDNAVLIALAYPESIVRTTDSFYSKLLPWIGMGVPGRMKAGHACMVIAKEGSDTFEYYDFGRYITPLGLSRVRGANTDPELTIDVKAKWNGKQLLNLEELLRWLRAHPEKTHGTGNLYASVSEKVNYERVKEYISIMQKKELWPYGPFVSEGSNCSRFVTGAMYHGILDKEIHKKVKRLYWFTPSVLGNVDAANSYDKHIVVSEDSVLYASNNLKLEQYKILFDMGEGYSPYCPEGSLVPPSKMIVEEDWQWLGGIGSGVWYDIEPTRRKNLFFVSCYNHKGKKEYSALYKSHNKITLPEDFEVSYPSNYKVVTVMVDSVPVRLKRVQKAELKKYDLSKLCIAYAPVNHK